ncbi:MAG: DUF305 domain-containing protein [Microcella sp.]|uniref:DUF305 domain-containing protein n=1 Tax=Microcella sp. TaxID=1913979 RepID=UPI0024C97865|nr:DUF305 domain-containing protein [Microcella sp.]UYN83482.1 MAG: DUF305 domain-containing protein [Microcella sp.]
MKKSFRTRALAAGALALISMVGLAACSTTTEPSESSGANMADVMFVQMMIPHHEGAIEMSDILLSKSDVDPEVVALAEQIKAAQGPEIEQMKQWLDDWGMPTMSDNMDGMDHGGMGGMAGMTEEDMQALEDASGSEAGELFLEQMIVHHEGAIEMAEDVLDDGEHPGVRELARNIVASQKAEIELMRSMLDS